MPEPEKKAVYLPDVYEVNSLERAKKVIVTAEKGTTTDERWERETAFLAEDIVRHLPIGADDCVLDYGCGIGRVAKALIDRAGCRVVGVDFSKSMRLLAPEYVLSERFTIWSPEVLSKMAEKGFRVSRVICLWVLQHVLRPPEVIQLIDGVMSPGALLYVLNGKHRCIPTNVGYVSDRADIAGELRKTFEELTSGALPVEATTPEIAAHSHIQVLRKKS